MAAISNATLVADVAENINSEFIAQEVRYHAQKPYLYDGVVHKVNLAGRHTATYSEPIADELTAATSLTATDEVAAQKTARADLTVGIAPYGTAVFLDYETVRRSMWDEFGVAFNRLIGACRRKIDNDVMALASSLSNSIGSASTVHSALNHNTVLTAWRAQVGSTVGTPLQIVHGDTMRDLGEDAATNAAGLMSTVIGVQLHQAAGQVTQGVRRRIGNVEIDESNSVPAGDTTGWANFMVMNNPAEHAIVMPYEQEIVIELAHKPERRGWFVVASCVYGVGITNHDYGLAFITRT